MASETSRVAGTFNYAKMVSAAATAAPILYAALDSDGVMTVHDWAFAGIGTAVLAFMVWLVPNIDVKALLDELVTLRGSKQATTTNVVTVAPGSAYVKPVAVQDAVAEAVKADWLPQY